MVLGSSRETPSHARIRLHAHRSCSCARWSVHRRGPGTGPRTIDARAALPHDGRRLQWHRRVLSHRRHSGQGHRADRRRVGCDARHARLPHGPNRQSRNPRSNRSGAQAVASRGTRQRAQDGRRGVSSRRSFDRGRRRPTARPRDASGTRAFHRGHHCSGEPRAPRDFSRRAPIERTGTALHRLRDFRRRRICRGARRAARSDSTSRNRASWTFWRTSSTTASPARWIARCREPSSCALRPPPTDIGLFFVVMHLRNEGIADQVDKPYPLPTQAGMEWYSKGYNEAYPRTPALLRSFDSLLTIAADHPQDVRSLVAPAQKLFWSNGHSERSLHGARDRRDLWRGLALPGAVRSDRVRAYIRVRRAETRQSAAVLRRRR